jgi:hypothetical protein
LHLGFFNNPKNPARFCTSSTKNRQKRETRPGETGFFPAFSALFGALNLCFAKAPLSGSAPRRRSNVVIANQ